MAVAKWLQSVTQWSSGLSSIIFSNSSNQVLLARNPQVRSFQVPPVAAPHTQASLNQLLSHVFAGSSLHSAAATKILQDIAATMPLSGNDWSLLTATNWNAWPTNFTGKQHCPSVLASMLETKPKDGIMKIAMVLPPFPLDDHLLRRTACQESDRRLNTLLCWLYHVHVCA